MVIIENLIKKILRIFGIEIKRFSKKIHPLSTHDIDLLIDIGANTGQYASIARKIGYKKRIISFEPLIQAHNKLVEISSNDPLWEIYKRCAVGSENKKVSINISENSYSSSILEITKSHTDVNEQSKFIGSEEVEVITMDTFFDKYKINEKKIFIKIDTQGYEEQVLIGFSKNIEKIYAFQIELSTVELYKNQKIFEFFIDYFSSRNFFLWDIEEGFRNRKTGQILQFDGIFINKKLFNQKLI